MAAGQINYANPVSDHPLNAGLASWWLPLPNSQGGGKLFDLKGKSNGTLTNGPAWVSGRAGGSALTFAAASSQRVDLPDLSAYNGSAAASLVLVLRRTTATPSADSNAGCWRVRGNDLSFNAHYPYTDGKIYLGVFNGDNVGRPINGYDDSSYNKTVWHHLAIVNRGSGAGDYRLIRDGTLVTSGTGLSSCTFGAAPALGFSVTGSYGDFVLADVRLYPARALTDSEAAALYEQSLRGHPDLLRRYSPKAYLFRRAASGTTESPSPVAAASSAAAPSLALSQAASPAAAASGVAGPAVSLSAPASPVTAASGVVAPSLSLSQAPSPVAAAGAVSVPAPAAGLTQLAEVITAATGAATEAASVAVAQAAAPAAAGSSAETPTVSQGYVVSPAPAGVSALVAAGLTTALTVSPSPVGALVLVITPAVSGPVVVPPIIDLVVDFRATVDQTIDFDVRADFAVDFRSVNTSDVDFAGG